MKQIVLPSVVVGILCGACATSSDKVAATYVSPIQYSNLSCTQIREEAGRVSVRAAQAAGAQDEKRRGDQVATTVGAVVFLPALAAAFLLTFARIGTMMMLMPGFGETNIPTRIKLSIALGLTLIILPLHRSAYQIDMTSIAPLVVLMLHEIVIGIVLGAKAAVYRSVEFIVDFFRSTPATAMFPLFLLLFGLGDLAKIAVAAFAAWLVIVFNVAYGVMNARQTRILAARSMGASSLRIFRDVIFFETLPQTFIGLRTAVSLALVVIIVAEMFIGATDGMGHRIIDAQISYSLTDMYGSILIAGAMGYGLNLILLFLERSIVHWSGK